MADPLQDAIRKSFVSRTQRFQAVLNAVAGEARYKLLKEELERKLEGLETDLERGWVKSEDLAARVAAVAGQEIARAEQALRKDLASTESLERAQRSLARSIEDALASSAFFDRVAEVVRGHVADHEKKQPHPTPRELSGIIVQTVREVFADGAKLTPEEIANVAKVQAESTVQKALVSPLWTAEVSRIATVEAERVAGEHAKRLQEDAARLKRAVGAEGLRQLETPEGKEILDKTIRAAVREAVPTPAALAETVKGEVRAWSSGEDLEKQVAAAARKSVEEAIAAHPSLKPEMLAASLKKVITDSAEMLRKDLAGSVQHEAAAREAATAHLQEAVLRLQKDLQESVARFESQASEQETGVSEDAARALAAAEAAKALQGAGLLTEDAARRIAKDEISSFAAQAPASSAPGLTAEAVRSIVLSEGVQKELKASMQSVVAEAVRNETQALLRKIDEGVARRAEEAVAKAASGGSPDPVKLAVTIEEVSRRLLKEEIRPLKEALLSALPVEIQHALEGIVERQGADWGSQLLNSEPFLDAVAKAVAEEMDKATGELASRIEEPEEAPRHRFARSSGQGTIKEHFLAMREKNRWKKRNPGT